MTTLRVEILTPPIRRGEITTLFISRGLCKVGNEYVDMKTDGAKRGVQHTAQRNPKTKKLESCKYDYVYFEENDGAPGTEWRFKILPKEKT